MPARASTVSTPGFQKKRQCESLVSCRLETNRREGTIYQRILAALEGKKTVEVVVAHVQRLAAPTNAVVTLLQVIAVADDGGGGLGRQFQLEVGSSGWRRKNQAAMPCACNQRNNSGSAQPGSI